MEDREIKQIEEQIRSLPKGIITVKHIQGREYEYWQYRENGRQISKRIKGEELETIQAQINERKRLEKILEEYRKGEPESVNVLLTPSSGLRGLIRTGDDMIRFTEPVRKFRKREIFAKLSDFIYSADNDRIFIMYGLRRTGKTTMIRQVILDMTPEMKKITAFVQISPKETLADLNKDLQTLENLGYRYIFIDEVTLLSDFIEGAALFSDIYAASGMKIVLSGTDSLGFLFAEDEQLYDRCYLLHTTFIPYREFETVLGIKGIDQYIRYGGTMSLGGVDYNQGQMTFSSEKRTNEYIDSAIARNIQHSLRNYQHEGHFRALYDLYEKDELTSAINRVVEDINHRFTLEVLTNTFKSHDLGVSKTNLRKDRENPSTVLDEIDLQTVTERLKTLLEIRNKEEQTVALTPEHVREIREYLEMLDLIRDIDVESAGEGGNSRKRTVFTQPGLRYAQAEALITSLMQDESFRDLGIKERMRITDRILAEIRGRMMEDIILLETKVSEPEKRVFVYQFPVGEFDMVVFDPKAVVCHLYEIKHSTEIVPFQYRHLIDPEKLEKTEKQYGKISGRSVIYNGDDAVQDNITYRNAEKYLLELRPQF